MSSHHQLWLMTNCDQDWHRRGDIRNISFLLDAVARRSCAVSRVGGFLSRVASAVVAVRKILRRVDLKVGDCLRLDWVCNVFAVFHGGLLTHLIDCSGYNYESQSRRSCTGLSGTLESHWSFLSQIQGLVSTWEQGRCLKVREFHSTGTWWSLNLLSQTAQTPKQPSIHNTICQVFVRQLLPIRNWW